MTAPAGQPGTVRLVADLPNVDSPEYDGLLEDALDLLRKLGCPLDHDAVDADGDILGDVAQSAAMVLLWRVRSYRQPS